MAEAEQSLAARLADAVGEDYSIEGEIGRGGMGVVYLARDLKLKRRVAVKVLPPELAYRSEIKTRFLREAQTAARLSHPHIVPIHGVGEAGGLVYFVMGYVDGESLGGRLKRRGKLPIEECRRITKETADALGLAHTMGIIHRDVKPDNILLDGTRRRVMVTDFGIAKALTDVGTGTLTGTGVAIGTPTYMSPEQAAGEGEIDARSDIYALGVVAYEMITGRAPFKAPTVPAILMKQITEPPPDIMSFRPECPEELAATVMRCLEKDPEERWSTADSLRRALDTRNPGAYQSRRPRSNRAGAARRSSASARRASGGRDSPGRNRPSSSTRDRRPSNPSSRRSRRPPVPGSRPLPDRRRSRRRDLERKRREQNKLEEQTESGEPKIVRSFRNRFASYVSFNGSLMLLNLLTSGLDQPWFLIPAAIMGFPLARDYGRLWSEGYSWRDVIDRPPAADSVGAGQGERAGRLPSAEPRTEEFGALTAQMKQVHNDRKAIVQIVSRLADHEKEMLPDIVPTVDNLTKRATELARGLAAMETDSLGDLKDLDARIDKLGAEEQSKDRDRRIDLLKRQRQTVADLTTRKKKVEGQFESCVLAIQNMRFDLLRLKSAGVSAVLDNLTQVTQQAKALNLDINAAIEANNEIRAVLGSPKE